MDSYPIPFHLRRNAPRYALTNTGQEPLRAVTVAVIAQRRVWVLAPITMAPGESLVFHNPDAPDASAIVRWLRPDDSEYLWRAAL